MEQDALAYLQSAGAPATPQNMNRIMMAFMDNQALRPSYNAGSYTADGTFIGADGQGAAVGSYEAGRAAIMRGDAPDAVRERFIRAYGDPGRLTFDMGMPEATTGARAEPIERVELENMGAGVARSGQPTQTASPRTETVTPTRKPMPVDALSPVMTAADAGGDDIDGIMLPPVVPLAPRQTQSGNARGVPNNGVDPVRSPQPGLPPPNRNAVNPQGQLDLPKPTNAPDPNTRQIGGPREARTAAADEVITPEPPRRPSGNSETNVGTGPVNRSPVDAVGSDMPKPTTDAKGMALPASGNDNTVPKQLDGAGKASVIREFNNALAQGIPRAAEEALAKLNGQIAPENYNQLFARITELNDKIRQGWQPEQLADTTNRLSSDLSGIMQQARILEQAINKGDVRTANEALTVMRGSLTPEQIDGYRARIEALDPVGKVLQGLRSGITRR